MRSLKFFLFVLFFVSCQKEMAIPEVVVTVVPNYGDTTTLFVLEAQNSLYIDKSLRYRWDYDSDGSYDTDFSCDNQVVISSNTAGWNFATVEITLSNGEIISQIAPYYVFISNPDTSTFEDPRDNYIYKTVRLNGRWWFAENLRYGGVLTSEIQCTDNDLPEVYVWEDSTGNISLYGGLYSWFELMDYEAVEGGKGLCPDGWHIPSVDEWKSLVVDSLPMQIVWNCAREDGYWNFNLIAGLYHQLAEEAWNVLPEINSSVAPFAVNYWTSSFQKITVPRILDPIPYVGRLPYDKNGFEIAFNGYDTESLKVDLYKDLYPVRCIRDE